jgi:hypothetical protein
LHERVWRLVEAEKTTIATKHEGDLAAYRVLSLKAGRRDPSGTSPAGGR